MTSASIINRFSPISIQSLKLPAPVQPTPRPAVVFQTQSPINSAQTRWAWETMHVRVSRMSWPPLSAASVLRSSPTHRARAEIGRALSPVTLLWFGWHFDRTQWGVISALFAWGMLEVRGLASGATSTFAAFTAVDV